MMQVYLAKNPEGFNYQLKNESSANAEGVDNLSALIEVIQAMVRPFGLKRDDKESKEYLTNFTELVKTLIIQVRNDSSEHLPCSAMSFVLLALNDALIIPTDPNALLIAAGCNETSISDEGMVNCSLPQNNTTLCSAVLTAVVFNNYSAYFSFPQEVLLNQKNPSTLDVLVCYIKRLQVQTETLVKLSEIFKIPRKAMSKVSSKMAGLLEVLQTHQSYNCFGQNDSTTSALLTALYSNHSSKHLNHEIYPHGSITERHMIEARMLARLSQKVLQSNVWQHLMHLGNLSDRAFISAAVDTIIIEMQTLDLLDKDTHHFLKIIHSIFASNNTNQLMLNLRGLLDLFDGVRDDSRGTDILHTLLNATSLPNGIESYTPIMLHVLQLLQHNVTYDEALLFVEVAEMLKNATSNVMAHKSQSDELSAFRNILQTVTNTSNLSEEMYNLGKLSKWMKTFVNIVDEFPEAFKYDASYLDKIYEIMRMTHTRVKFLNSNFLSSFLPFSVVFGEQFFTLLKTHGMNLSAFALSEIVEDVKVLKDLESHDAWDISMLWTLLNLSETLMQPQFIADENIHAALNDKVLELLHTYLLETNRRSREDLNSNCSSLSIIRQMISGNMSHKQSSSMILLQSSCDGVFEALQNVSNCSSPGADPVFCTASIALDMLKILHKMSFGNSLTYGRPTFLNLPEMLACYLQGLHHSTNNLLRIAQIVGLPSPVLFNVSLMLKQLSAISKSVNKSVCFRESDPLANARMDMVTFLLNASTEYKVRINEEFNLMKTAIHLFQKMRQNGLLRNNTQFGSQVGLLEQMIDLLQISSKSEAVQGNILNITLEIASSLVAAEKMLGDELQNQLQAVLQYINQIITVQNPWIAHSELFYINAPQDSNKMSVHPGVERMAQEVIKASNVLTQYVNGSSSGRYVDEILVWLEKLQGAIDRAPENFLNLILSARKVSRLFSMLTRDANDSVLVQRLATLADAFYNGTVENVTKAIDELENVISGLLLIDALERDGNFSRMMEVLDILSSTSQSLLEQSNFSVSEAGSNQNISELLRVFETRNLSLETMSKGIIQLLSIIYDFDKMDVKSGFDLLRTISEQNPALEMISPLINKVENLMMMVSESQENDTAAFQARITEMELCNKLDEAWTMHNVFPDTHSLHIMLQSVPEMMESGCQVMRCKDSSRTPSILRLIASTLSLGINSIQKIRPVQSWMNVSCMEMFGATGSMRNMTAKLGLSMWLNNGSTCHCQTMSTSHISPILDGMLAILKSFLPSDVHKEVTVALSALKDLDAYIGEEHLWQNSKNNTGNALELWENLRAAFEEILIGGPEDQQHAMNISLKILLDPLYRDFGSMTNFTTGFAIDNFDLDENVPVLRVKDLVNDPDSMERQLLHVVNLTMGSSKAIMNARLTSTKMGEVLTSAFGGSCNNVLSKIVVFPEGSDPLAVTSELCQLSASSAASLIITFVQHLNIRTAIYKVIMPPGLQQLERALIQIVTELVDYLKTLQPFKERMHHLVNVIQQWNLTGSLGDNQSGRRRRSTKTYRVTPRNMVEAICSGNSQPVIDRVHRTSQRTLPKEEALTQRLSQNMLPSNTTPFCESFYNDIRLEGAFVWRFVEPMLLGQVIYTPDTPDVRLLLNKANSTFLKFDELRQYSELWLSSRKSLEDSQESLHLLKNALKNSFVQGLIQSKLMINPKKLLSDLNQYTNLSENELAGTVLAITALSEFMVNVSDCILLDRFRGVSDETSLASRIHDLQLKNKHMASVIFHEVPTNKKPSRRLNYTIRLGINTVMPTDRVEDLIWGIGPVTQRSKMNYQWPFLPLQDMFERAAVEVLVDRPVDEPLVQTQPFPFPCHVSDSFVKHIGLSLPLIMILAWVLVVPYTAKCLVEEEEMKVKQYLQMMGVLPFSRFLTWILTKSISIIFISFMLSIILKASQTLFKSDGVILFFLFLTFGLSILSLSYLIASLHSRANIAALTGCFIYILSFFPYMSLTSINIEVPTWLEGISCLLAPTALSYAFKVIVHFEELDIGIQWHNQYSKFLPINYFSFFWWMLFIDSIIYFLLGWYIFNVFPGKCGLQKPWYFLFTSAHWRGVFGRKSKQNCYFLPSFAYNNPVTGDTLENGLPKNQVPMHVVGVALQDVEKYYNKRNDAALKNLSVEFFENQITSLIGHNGAGKSTTIALLTGLYEPSSGYVFVKNQSENGHEDSKSTLGVCLQQDILFPNLTVRDHLVLYRHLKAPFSSKKEKENEVNEFLKNVGLQEHENKLAGKLSGGMKRKLSISIAFIGGSSLVILDEPTSGIDPCSRRGIWDVILNHRVGRTIILSTHHLDEAEVLSDRIAVLKQGCLTCCGTLLELKENYGQGSMLSLAKQAALSCDTESVTNLICTHIPAAQLLEDSKSQMMYALPAYFLTEPRCGQALFQDLQNKLQDLGLVSFSITNTTLEDVFMRMVDNEAEEEYVNDTEKPHINGIANYEETSRETNVDGTKHSSCMTLECNEVTAPPEQAMERLTGLSRMAQQVAGLFLLRLHRWRRDWKGAFMTLFLPVLLVIIAMAFVTIQPGIRNYPSLRLTPDLYSGYTFFSSNSSSPTANALVTALLCSPTFGQSCANNSLSRDIWTTVEPPQMVCSCSCKEGCDVTKYNAPRMKLTPSLLLYDLTGLPMDTYLLLTTCSFLGTRHAGFTFGNSLSKDLSADVDDVPSNRTLTKVWYNGRSLHAIPAYLNTFYNLLLQSNLPDDADPLDYEIIVNSHPYSGQQIGEDYMLEAVGNVGVSLCILLAFSILVSKIGSGSARERIIGACRLQYIAGVSSTLFWLVTFIFDMLCYLVTVLICLCVIAAFDLPMYTDDNNLGIVLLLLLTFGFATLPWMYIFSGFFTSEEGAIVSFITINIVFGVTTVLSLNLIEFIKAGQPSSLDAAKDVLEWFYLIFPQFCLGQGFVKLSKHYMEKSRSLLLFGTPTTSPSYGWDFTGSHLLAMAVQGVLFLCLRLVLRKTLFRKTKDKYQVPPANLDEDVLAERIRIEEGRVQNDVLQVVGLHKRYQRLQRKFTAVDGIYFGVSKGECFGLLGINGAGKTTTFKMLTGDLWPTSGRTLLRTTDDTLLGLEEAQKCGVEIGYCPQFDALDPMVSGLEHLCCYARLRGIPSRYIDEVATNLMERLWLSQHGTKRVGHYSGGTKRKLSTALALLGQPQLLLLDEPSSGMDPKSKRLLWQTISQEVARGGAVVLTSHSMEECEALCNKLAIMVKGQFQCLGTLQHIKKRFSDGYSVKIKINQTKCDVMDVEKLMCTHCPGTLLKDKHAGQFEFQVPSTAGSLADMFAVLEDAQQFEAFQYFSISQMTLDQVFINFAKKQEDAEEKEEESFMDKVVI
uniref:glucosylceramide transporter ABCA12-like isoform X2 n=1 Tax=Myxine glutinosa TaxID=7769 RepID=UPI00358E9143